MSTVIEIPCYIGLTNKIGFYKKIYIKNIVSSSICYQPKLESSTTLYFSEFPLSVKFYSVTEQNTQGGYIPAMDYIEPFSKAVYETIDEKRLRQIISKEAKDDDLYCSELKRLGIAQEDINRLSRFEPLTPNAKNLIITACGSGEIICIKKFLERNLPNENFGLASWLEILWAIYHIQKKTKIEWRHTLSIPQIIDELSDYIKQGTEQEIPPGNTPSSIDTKGWWSCKNLTKLRDIDSSSKRDGIIGTKKHLKDLKAYLKIKNRCDIAKTLKWEKGRIKTTIPYRKMFLQV